MIKIILLTTTNNNNNAVLLCVCSAAYVQVGVMGFQFQFCVHIILSVLLAKLKYISSVLIVQVGVMGQWIRMQCSVHNILILVFLHNIRICVVLMLIPSYIYVQVGFSFLNALSAYFGVQPWSCSMYSTTLEWMPLINPIW